MSSSAIVVVSHNTREHLRACLESICAEGEIETHVVDHASVDGTREMVLRQFPWVALHACPDNPGYAAGANRGMAACRAEHVLLLNADCTLRPLALDVLFGRLERSPQVGVVAPALEDPQGRLQRSVHPRPTPFNLFCELSPIWRLAAFVPGLKQRSPFTSRHDHARAVHWAKGAALAIRRAAFDRAGGFDERFFLYFEDADFCDRVTQAGWEVRFQPEARVIHAHEASTRKRYADAREHRLHSLSQFYRKRYRGSTLRLALASVKLLGAGRWVTEQLRPPARPDPLGEEAAALPAVWERLGGGDSEQPASETGLTERAQ